ncbi:DNA-binding protein [Sinimarinibacterium sp. CAU 1509]|uniref:DNA-binding protein n=1 Tax=Sinimarinibacterium sp. CAU 1509 TaxID=2562283 RepID=UPI00146C1774|nr:DNA-binding protein [Sinimarinibacterium sp. CAU 1509]
MSEAPAPITYDDVVSAAQALLNGGEKATTIAVREQLGRGSFTTIKKHLDRWNAEQAPSPAPAPSVPPQLESLWTEARREAEERLAAERAALEQLSAQLDARLHAMEVATAEAQRERASAEARLADKDLELGRLAPLLDDMRVQRDCALAARDAMAGQLDRERDAWIARLDAQHAQFVDIKQAQERAADTLADVPGTIRGAHEGLMRAFAALRSAAADYQGAQSVSLKNQESALKHVATMLEDVDRRVRLPRRKEGFAPALRAARPVRELKRR